MATAAIDPTTGLPRINQVPVVTPASAVATPASVINPNTPVPTLATNTVVAPAVPASPAWTPTPGVVRIDRGNATSYANADSGLEYGNTAAALAGGAGGTRPAWATDAVLNGGYAPGGLPTAAPVDTGAAVPNSQGILGMPEGAGGSYNSLTAPGASTAPIPGAPGNMTNPFAAASAGFDRQGQNAQGYLRQALDYIDQGTDIFDRATRARAINGILGAVAGPNNAGAVYGQGADSLNSGAASITGAGIGAGAQITSSGIQAAASTRNEDVRSGTLGAIAKGDRDIKARAPVVVSTRQTPLGVESTYASPIIPGQTTPQYAPITAAPAAPTSYFGKTYGPQSGPGKLSDGQIVNLPNGVTGKIQNGVLVPAT